MARVKVEKAAKEAPQKGNGLAEPAYLKMEKTAEVALRKVKTAAEMTLRKVKEADDERTQAEASRKGAAKV